MYFTKARFFLLAVIPMFIIRTVVGWLVPDWASWHLITYLLTVLLVSIPSALAGVAMYDVLQRIIGKRMPAMLVVIGIWLGTIVFPFSTLYFGHAQAVACLVGSFLVDIPV